MPSKGYKNLTVSEAAWDAITEIAKERNVSKIDVVDTLVGVVRIKYQRGIR